MWLSAHLIACTKERLTVKEEIGDVAVWYQSQPKGFFQQTQYGQMVLLLDTTGAFQSNSKKKASFTAIKQIN